MSENPLAPFPTSSTVSEIVCADASSDCHEHGSVVSAIPQKLDGAGEPCPVPLVWREIRENYLRDSLPWEIISGTRRLIGRTWGSGRPLYFLNNFAGTAELFSLTAWLLKDEFCCVMFDTVVEDRRTSRASRPTISDLSDDLFAIADQHGDERFSLFGAAFGAAIGLQAALNRPERIDRLMLQHAFARRRLSIFERVLASNCLRSCGTLDELPQRRRFQSVNHQPWFPPFDDSRFEFLIESSGTLSLRDLAKRALAMNSFDVSSRLAEIDCPVLLLRTEGEGRVAADSQNLLEKKMKSPEIQWMHSAGQHPYLTHPHRVSKLIKTFCGT
jgi:pimeloyl-ACP methyl ester carboxylesterase